MTTLSIDKQAPFLLAALPSDLDRSGSAADTQNRLAARISNPSIAGWLLEVASIET